jgi:formylglycine-generating enzyme required for sulfatase activity
MAAKIFISYRRDDSAGHAGRVHDRLEREFGRDLLFMDVDAIPLGVNFVKVLEEQVAKCDVLLAIIGPGWLDARDDDGKRRLDNPHDYIRIEIAAALKREIPVIPILLEGVRLPKAPQLPNNLKDLVLRNGLDVRHASFHSDMDRLVRGLRGRDSAQQSTEGRVKFDARIVHGAPEGWFLPGNGKVEWFQDHEYGPEMVVVPAGSFVMGSPEGEPQRMKDVESPQHNVTIAKPFGIARCAVTRGQFTAFVNSAGHKTKSGAVVWKGGEWKEDPKASWRDPGFAQDDDHPVVCVSWNDAKAYVAWISSQTHCDYRLPTEAEWEYCCRAGSASPFWGARPSRRRKPTTKGITCTKAAAARVNGDRRQCLSISLQPILGGFIKSTATCWSGAKTCGTTTTTARQRMARRGWKAAMRIAVWSAAVLGTTIRSTFGLPRRVHLLRPERQLGFPG